MGYIFCVARTRWWRVECQFASEVPPGARFEQLGLGAPLVADLGRMVLEHPQGDDLGKLAS